MHSLYFPHHSMKNSLPTETVAKNNLQKLAGTVVPVLLVTVGILDPGEAVLEQAAIQVPSHLLVDEAPPETVPALEALLPLPPHLVVQRLEKAEGVRGSRTAEK